jgi:hypothetical protein
MWFILSLLFLISVHATCDVTSFTAEVTANIITGKVCDVWTGFAKAQTCNVTDYYYCYSVAHPFCDTIVFDFQPSNCIEAGLCLTTCISSTLLPKSTKTCSDCFASYETQSSQLCTKTGADAYLALSNCFTAKALCPGVECDVDCTSLIPDVNNKTLSFDACLGTGTNSCPCYFDFTASVNLYSICEAAKGATLSACVRSQFDCTTTQSTCDAVDISLTIPDIKAIFLDSAQDFLTVWNNHLTEVTVTTINYVDEVTDQLKFTVQANYDANLVTIDEVCQKLKDIFGTTTGLPSVQYTLTVQSSAKRALQTTSEIDVVGSGPSGSGAVGVSVVMTPILCFMAIIFYYLQ